MTTVVVYKTDTKEVLAAIPMDGGEETMAAPRILRM